LIRNSELKTHRERGLFFNSKPETKNTKLLWFVESLPHTELGKVNKVKVRDTFVQAGVVGISQKQQG
jgi:hypothetical protein